MSLELPFDEIPDNHFLRFLLRTRFYETFRKDFKGLKKLGKRPKYLHHQRIYVTPHHTYRMEYRRHWPGNDDNTGVDDYTEDDVFVIYEKKPEGFDFLGYVKFRGGMMHDPIKRSEVEFSFYDLLDREWFTVGPSRRKQQLNRNRSTAAVMAATRPETAHLLGLTRSVNPGIAAAYIAPMLGADGQAVTAAANAETDRVHAEMAEEKRLERMRTVLEGYNRKRTRKSGKRTRRTRRH